MQYIPYTTEDLNLLGIESFIRNKSDKRWVVSIWTFKSSFTFHKKCLLYKKHARVYKRNDLTSDSTYLASLNVSSLFMIIPLKETIDIATKFAFENQQTFNGLSKTQFKKLLIISSHEWNRWSRHGITTRTSPYQ